METHGFPTGFALPSFAENSRSPTLSQSKPLRKIRGAHFAAGLGLEPRYIPPEGIVLPLDDPAIRREYVKNTPYSTVDSALERGQGFDRIRLNQEVCARAPPTIVNG